MTVIMTNYDGNDDNLLSICHDAYRHDVIIQHHSLLNCHPLVPPVTMATVNAVNNAHLTFIGIPVMTVVAKLK